MTENEQSAKNLDWWIGEQEKMKEAELRRLASLQTMAEASAQTSATGIADEWLTDAIKEYIHRVERLSQSITASHSLRKLALANRLHNPLRS